jgi:hypothetical protein
MMAGAAAEAQVRTRASGATAATTPDYYARKVECLNSRAVCCRLTGDFRGAYLLGKDAEATWRHGETQHAGHCV